jgi:predicted amidophosphoribosyltransferase
MMAKQDSLLPDYGNTICTKCKKRIKKLMNIGRWCPYCGYRYDLEDAMYE